MATTDTRSGFRLPWSSDRPHDDTEATDAPDGAVDDAAEPTDGAQASATEPAPWPDVDIESRPSSPSEAHRPASGTAAPASSAPRKPSKLMVDLAAAIRATTEQARDQRLGQLETEAGSVVELIRAKSAEGSAALRSRADDDVAAIKEWAKAEIARIREESESRIGDRKRLLEREIEGHAAAIEDRVGVVETAVGDYRARINAYFERMGREDDPARLATMAEGMPEPPSLELLVELEAPEPVFVPEAPEDEPVTIAAAPEPVSAPAAEATGSAWAETASPWTTGAATEEPRAADGWDAPASIDDGEPAERDAIMAELEADAEAAVAAEAAEQAARAAVETGEPDAVEAGAAATDDDLDPEAEAAISARVDALGNETFETTSYADRLAGLLPGAADAGTGGETGTTQVAVTGLVSVASIASFKRHLGRLSGVVAVAVASGPDGGFIFNVTHRPDVSLRDAIATLPGFAARVTSSGDGVVSVTARDPETEA